MKHSTLIALLASALLPSSALAQTAPARASLFAPERRAGWEFTITPRLFLSLDHLAVGSLTDASVVRRFGAPVTLRAGVEPLAAVVGQEPLARVNGYAGVSFDTRFFEVGLDLGAARVNDNYSEPGGVRAMIGQRMRVGAADGVHLAARNMVYAGEDRFRWGGLVVSAQVPLTHAVALLARGGAGADGFALGELGARVRVRGDGGDGTLALIPTIGYGSLEGDYGCTSNVTGAVGHYPSCGRTSHAGPMIGLGIDYRL